MPGYHSSKQKRQAKHVIASERARGYSASKAKRIGWATVNKTKKGMNDSSSGPDDVGTKRLPVTGTTPKGKPFRATSNEEARAHNTPKPEDPSHNAMRAHTERMLAPYTHTTKNKVPRSKTPTMRIPVVKGGGFQLTRKSIALEVVTVDDLLAKSHRRIARKGMQAMPKPAGSPKPPGLYLPGVHNPKSPVRAGKTSIKRNDGYDGSDADSMEKADKKPRPLAAWQIAQGWTDAKGTKAPAVAKPAETAMARPTSQKPPAKVERAPHSSDYSADAHAATKVADKTGTAEAHIAAANAHHLASDYHESKGSSDLAADHSRAGEKHLMAASKIKSKTGSNAISRFHKSNHNGATMSKTDNLEDLFKSEIGDSDDAPIIDCPHCDHAITKSDVLAKAGKKRNKNTPERKVVSDNKGGANHRGPESGRNGSTPTRTVGKVPKVDNAKRITKKSDADALSDDEDVNKGDDASSEIDDVTKSEGKCPKCSSLVKAGTICKCGVMMKSDGSFALAPPSTQHPRVSGSEYVQYVNTGEDERIAKLISEGAFGYAQVTQPLDKNNSGRR